MASSLMKHQRGVGLIEVLVTVLIISTALMGLAALQSRSLQYNQGAYFRSQANIQASDVLDRLRVYAGRDSAWVGDAVAGLPRIDTAAATDINNWKINVSTSLPDGDGSVSCVMQTRVCTARITWTNLNSSGQDSENKSTFTYSAKL